MILIFLFINNTATSMLVHTFSDTGAFFPGQIPKRRVAGHGYLHFGFPGGNQNALQPASTHLYSNWQSLERIISLQPAST